MKSYPLLTLILCPFKSAMHNLFVGTPQQCDGTNCMCFVEDVAGVSGHCGLIFEPIIKEVTTVKTVEAVTNIQSIDDPIVGEPV